MDLHFFVLLACHARAIFLTGEGVRANRGGVHDGGAFLLLFFAMKYRFLCSRTRIVVFFGDDHGGEAMVGRRDTNWARGISAITAVLLLSPVWVMGAVFADRNAPALGGILNQQGVVGSSIYACYTK